ncbi:type II toxin-antitoxin system VapC family toxin [Cyanobacterium aponinum]|uniref:type II toxin-antitoxin system VapC family toxin n=1 Tax=Cyanobacterium aponinum TaxID=379064 RepID=UPI000C129D4C|nr:PIN domain-containing protein [Cyanobacterium aponinum]PHV63122.1 PIN domain nuclease [Cyanobacterium aponinum IPPAS B-1201]
MKVLIDTNIILDLALTRANFYQEADEIFNLIEEGKFIGFVSATTLTDIYCILTKQKGKQFAFEFLKHLITVCKINPITESIIIKALNNFYKDFEDDIQYYSAITNNLDAIVTRNVQDFPQNNLTILQPSELINIFKD